MPVFGTIASQFNDPGSNALYKAIINKFLESKLGGFNSNFGITNEIKCQVFLWSSKIYGYLKRAVREIRAKDEGSVRSQRAWSNKVSLRDSENWEKSIVHEIPTKFLSEDSRKWARIQEESLIRHEEFQKICETQRNQRACG